MVDSPSDQTFNVGDSSVNFLVYIMHSTQLAIYPTGKANEWQCTDDSGSTAG